jgi:IS30 family transposase
MAARKRGLDAGEKRELWRRWREGQSLSDIARALQKHPGSVFGYISATGGIAPSERSRSQRCLSADEREEISRGLSVGESVRSIARRLGRSASTVSREVKRNGGRARYRATTADAEAWCRALRPKACKLALQPQLRDLVASRLAEDWSPEQISGWLRQAYPEDDHLRVSHETIYRSLFVQARGVLKRELQQHLRSRRHMRHGKHSTTAGQQRGRIIDAVSIRDRPVEVADRAVPGHWEGDLIAGSKNSYIATLVERATRYTMLVQVDGKDSDSVVAAMTKQVKRLPAELRRSLTWDRGMEMAQHKSFTIATDVKVYFCDPQSPWQRGTNENTNRLLRQYFPKGTDVSRYSQSDLNAVANRLNTRPRKTLGYKTPSATLAEALR